MIEELAVVAKIENNQVWVQAGANKGCGGCQQKSSCSTSVLDKLTRKREVAVDSEIELKAGDEVVIGIEEGVLIKASLLLYLIPLLAMGLAGGLTQQLLPAGFVRADLVTAGVALASLGSSLWLINKLQRSFFFAHFPRPVVIKKLLRSS